MRPIIPLEKLSWMSSCLVICSCLCNQDTEPRPCYVVTEPRLDHTAEEPSGSQRSWKVGGLFYTGGLRGDHSPEV